MRIIFTLMIFFGFLFADVDTKKLVIDLTTANANTYKAKILNAIKMNKKYYKSIGEELKVAVVIHGSSYKFFFKEINATKYQNDVELKKVFIDLKKQTKELSELYDVEFLMCGFGMKKHKIQKNQIVEYVKVVKNATVGLIDKQNQGYAYLPVGD